MSTRRLITCGKLPKALLVDANKPESNASIPEIKSMDDGLTIPTSEVKWFNVRMAQEQFIISDVECYFHGGLNE